MIPWTLVQIQVDAYSDIDSLKAVIKLDQFPAQLNVPSAVAVDQGGNLYIADLGNHRVRKVSSAGTITTVAGDGISAFFGDGGPATSAGLSYPHDVSVDGSGNLYIADSANNRVRKVSAAGIITTIAGNGSLAYAGDGGPAASAQLNNPDGVTIDSAGNVYVSDAGNSAVRRRTPCTYAISPASLQFPAAGGTLSFTITSAAACSWNISGFLSAPPWPTWIAISGQNFGTGPATVTLLVQSNSGVSRSGQISVSGTIVSVSQSSGFAVSAGGVMNDATYIAPVAPGSIAAVFGNFPTNMPSFSLQFGGISAPLFYAGANQLNVQVPWELAGQSQTTVVLGNENAAVQTVPLATYAPGIFTMNAQGRGQGAILDSSYPLVDTTSPAIPGTTVFQIYCTGLGPVTNQPPTGATAASNSLSWTTTTATVTIGGLPAIVSFSGLAPGYVGLYQVNALVPSGVPAGDAIPVVVSIGGLQSNSATIAVQ